MSEQRLPTQRKKGNFMKENEKLSLFLPNFRWKNSCPFIERHFRTFLSGNNKICFNWELISVGG